MKTGWSLRKDWSVWTLFIGAVIFANLGVSAWHYWEGDQLLGNSYVILAGVLGLLERA